MRAHRPHRSGTRWLVSGTSVLVALAALSPTGAGAAQNGSLKAGSADANATSSCEFTVTRLNPNAPGGPTVTARLTMKAVEVKASFFAPRRLASIQVHCDVVPVGSNTDQAFSKQNNASTVYKSQYITAPYASSYQICTFASYVLRDGASGRTPTVCNPAASLPTHTLTVSKSGSGSGGVIASGIDCGSDCTEGYANGTSVKLTPVPFTRSAFTGWSGDCSGTTTCTLSMTANKTAVATFDTTPGILECSPPSIEFGVVASLPDEAGPEAEAMVNCTNEGGTPVRVESLSVTGDSLFSASGCEGTTLEPTSYCTISVRFDPPRCGPIPRAEGGLYILHDGSNSSPIGVTLAGGMAEGDPLLCDGTQ